MDKHIQVMKHSVELSATIREGVDHLHKLLNQGEFENAIYIVEDVVKGFAAIQKSSELVKHDVDLAAVDSKMKDVQNALTLLVEAYEVKNHRSAREVVQFTLAPRVSAWQEELERAFEPYLVS